MKNNILMVILLGIFIGCGGEKNRCHGYDTNYSMWNV